jgi:zinc/manganese transport system substrate-binding protein
MRTIGSRAWTAAGVLFAVAAVAGCSSATGSSTSSTSAATSAAVTSASSAGSSSASTSADSSATSASSAGSAPTSSSGTGLSIVASTNVWGNVAQQIGGDQVQVTSFISDPSADPHEYQASPRNQLALSNAAVVIENGGGYDDFMDTMISAAGSKATVLNAVKLSGKQPVDGELNEHVWYDFPTTQKVVDALVAALSKADPAGAQGYSSRAATFEQDLATMEAQEKTISAKANGAAVAITEPVPLYMLEASGFTNKTPEAFSEAVEGGTDAPAAVLQQTLKLFDDHQVKALVYNEQTSDPQTETVLNQAKKDNVAVVPVTETLPDGKTYQTWMTDNLNALAAVVG